jgi:hypothetical protein
MPIGPLLIATLILLSIALTICIIIIFRMGRGTSAIPPLLDQRLVLIEGAITRSDTTIRDEFGRGREETRNSSRSLREEVTTLFGSLATSVRGSLTDLSTGQNTRLDAFETRLRQSPRRNHGPRSV